MSHWMHVEPLNRIAWPDYRKIAAYNGNAAICHLRYAKTSDAHLDAAVKFARGAARPAWIVIFGEMSPAELRAEGF